MTQARIFRPAKTAMQSGRANTKYWVLEFEPASPRWNEPLMGWTGTSDATASLRLKFASKEDAVAYAERAGLDYLVREPHRRRPRLKNYADKFRWEQVR